VHSVATRLIRTRRILAVVAAITIGPVSAAGAAVVSYIASLDGPSESPPVASSGIGSAQVDIDAVAHTMRVRASFAGLTGNSTNSHIHAPTAVAGAGTIGVATTTPTFPGFPSGVTFGIYDNTFDMTLASSYNAAFVTANGGTPALAEAALFQAIADGKAYYNIHSSFASSGEIRGFLQPLDPTPTNPATWGRIKSLYR
jgi:CHRD domain-containing protein